MPKLPIPSNLLDSVLPALRSTFVPLLYHRLCQSYSLHPLILMISSLPYSTNLPCSLAPPQLATRLLVFPQRLPILHPLVFTFINPSQLLAIILDQISIRSHIVFLSYYKELPEAGLMDRYCTNMRFPAVVTLCSRRPPSCFFLLICFPLYSTYMFLNHFPATSQDYFSSYVP